MAQAQNGANLTLEQLLNQQEEIAQRIRGLREQARAEGLAQIKEIMVRLDLTPKDLVAALGASKPGPKGKVTERPPANDAGSSKSAKSLTKVAQQFRNPDTGEGWSGRGLQPRWLKAKIEAGASLEDFRIK